MIGQPATGASTGGRPPSSADAPLFLIGAPRSGTSLLYKALCLHPDAAYISNWVRRFPALAPLAALDRVPRRFPQVQRRVWFGEDSNAYVYGGRRRLVDRIVPMPTEGEPVFARAGIAEHRPPPPAPGDARAAALRQAFSRIRRYDGGRVLVCKRIANNQRIPLLLEAFPAARFVELVRDGRAVALSLSQVDWWEESHIWWYGGTPRDWAAEGRDPWELCARNWVEELGAIEAGLGRVPGEQVLRLRYERFVTDPHAVLDEIAGFAGLAPSADWERRRAALRFPDRNERWRQLLDPDAVATIERVQAPALAQHGYAG